VAPQSPLDDADHWYRRGAQALEQGRLAEAEASFWACLAADDRHASALHLLGRVRQHQGQAEAALALQLASWRQDPALGWNAFAAAELLERAQRWGEAAAAFRAARDALPGESWISALASRNEGLSLFGGERLAAGLSPAAYRLWCRRFEPPLTGPGGPGADEVLPAAWQLQIAADAVLRPGARAWLSAWWATQPQEADLLYSDEDRLDADGRRHDPWFKPGWVPESFWSTPWLGSLALWRRAWLERQGLPPPPPAGEAAAVWRWQLQALACAPRIRHIDRVLVHRRPSPGPDPAARADRDLQPQATALAEHLRSLGEGPLQVDPLPPPPGATGAAPRFRLSWAVPASLRLSLVVLSRDRPDLLGRCLHDIERSRGQLDLEWLLVDNGSRQEATAALWRSWQQRPGSRVRVLQLDQPFNWSLLNNRAARCASGELLLFVNNDVAVPASTAAGWLSVMAGQARRAAIGCVGARLLYPDGSLQHAGVLPPLGAGCEHPYRGMAPAAAPHRGRLHHLSGWPAVTGACLMVRRDLWWRCGGFDAALPVEGNDVDFCLRLGQLGLRHVVCPEATLLHHEAASRPAGRSSTWGPAQLLLMRRWPAAMASGAPWWPAAAGLDTPDGRPRELAGHGWE